jgi:hypothetical protein
MSLPTGIYVEAVEGGQVVIEALHGVTFSGMCVSAEACFQRFGSGS